MLYFENVSKYYGKNETVALDRVSFQIAPKEFVSIVGHSGAGKTTLLKMLIAEDKPTEGAIFYESQDIHKISRAKLPSFRRKIGAFASASVARFSAVHWVRLRHSLPPADATASIFKGDTFAGDFVHLSN